MRKQHIKRAIERQVKKRMENSMRPVRFALPFPICCVSCKNYMNRFTRYNAQMEAVPGRSSCGAAVHRFAIKCEKCGCICTLLSDPENGCYLAEEACFRVPEKGGKKQTSPDASTRPGFDNVNRYVELSILKRQSRNLENIDIDLVIRAVSASKTIQQLRREELLETLRKAHPVKEEGPASKQAG